MKISVVIPALNEAQILGQTIERTWSAGPDQVIVVDGGSEDSTSQIAADRDCEVLCTAPSRGLQLNRGASHACGDVVLFLHADTWLAADGITQIRSALADRSAAVPFASVLRATACGIGWLPDYPAHRERDDLTSSN